LKRATALLRDQNAVSQRQLAERDGEVAALRVENATLRDDKAALTEALRAARQAAKKQPSPAETPSPRRGAKDPLAKYLWPSSRK
jgi:sRNA-binding protein